ncbi:RICIN domain-containing protein [Streptomyces sp. NA04227]|uniref:RICIN domain-containing protein n=1 Tax=Streptomyces sp. NA04227 TaxID=2742136 RepID=UPI001591B53C|nr:RICIN domain-containing protein [Streptomyces sp. NA04227]QKW06331.1 RICIN domain-containing protein [Streptomyces sp. NA04227]
MPRAAHHRRRLTLVTVPIAALATAVAAVALSQAAPETSTAAAAAPARLPAPAPGATVTVAAVGDICGSACNQTDDVVTAMAPDAVITAGDNAYEKGTLAEYNAQYDPAWGKFNARTYPTPGNHEYYTAGAAGYFDYYEGKGVPTGGRDKGYYSYDLGDWHMVALNSNAGMEAGSSQERWLRADLAESDRPCTMAYMHHPRFSSGDHGDNAAGSALYKALTDYKADVAVFGHDHHYERFAPAMADGTKDTANGLRSFVIGTGGRALYSSRTDTAGPSEVYNNNTFGVGRFELSPSGYSFSFKPVAGRTFTDSVTGTCHAKSGPAGTAPVLSGSAYELRLPSGHAIDNPNSSTTAGTSLVAWRANGARNQRWTVTRNSDGTYQLKNAASGMCADNANSSTTAGTKIVQWTCTGGDNQRWSILRSASGSGYHLVNKAGGLALAASAASSGAALTQQPRTDSPLQTWRFVKLP